MFACGICAGWLPEMEVGEDKVRLEGMLPWLLQKSGKDVRPPSADAVGLEKK
jgi:hypothetical protein